ncbi:MAG: hypothetical protein M3R08_04650 [Bacteroidota bacterium]|nr:hypothetical protein [Bacteroidota bacterium]
MTRTLQLLGQLTMCFLGIAMLQVANAQRSEFAIFKGSDKVGSIQVARSSAGDRVLYRMDSHSEFSIIWTQVVKTSVLTEYTRGVLTYCHSFLKVNDDVRDSSYMNTKGGAVQCYVHPEMLEQCDIRGEWTTARMYFEEPVSTTQIYVESVLTSCPLISSGPGNYTLTFPNKTQNHYVYRDGILQEVQVIRPLFDLLFRKV